MVQHLSQNGVDNTYDYWLSQIAKIQQINDIIACGLLANVHLREAYKQYMQLSSQNGHVGTRGTGPGTHVYTGANYPLDAYRQQ